MTIPLIVLAALSVLGGLLLLNDWIVDCLAPVTGTAEHAEPPMPAWRVRAGRWRSWPSASRIAWFLVGRRDVPRDGAARDVSFATSAARADLYGDAINEASGRGARRSPRPRPHVTSTSTGSTAPSRAGRRASAGSA